MTYAIYLKHVSGAMHLFQGRRAAKLVKELKAGRGGPEITELTLNGYEGFLAKSGEVLDFEALTPEQFNG